MKLEIGVPDYPWSGEIAGAHLKGRLPRSPVPLLIVDIKDLMDRQKKTQFMRGCPVMVALDRGKSRLWFFPTPNGEYEFVVPGSEEVEEPVEIIRVKKGRIAALAERLKGDVPVREKAKG